MFGKISQPECFGQKYMMLFTFSVVYQAIIISCSLQLLYYGNWPVEIIYQHLPMKHLTLKSGRIQWRTLDKIHVHCAKHFLLDPSGEIMLKPTGEIRLNTAA